MYSYTGPITNISTYETPRMRLHVYLDTLTSTGTGTNTNTNPGYGYKGVDSTLHESSEAPDNPQINL